ncbi:MAG TPA: hypothetical protein VJ912_04400 [Candidatus Nanoarchaeia archaeon]|nr:hypothetical protein [Candidatus Nanoarchaeia archaeon]
MKNYYIYNNEKFTKKPLKEIAEYAFNKKENIWSARISSGLFGLTNCKAGNRGPKKYNEIILGIGNEGLNKIIDLGFITCPVCKPEKTANFWEIIKYKVNEKYNINTLENFTDKNILNFDARRIKWEEILPIINNVPNRIYIPKNLSKKEIKDFKNRFLKTGFKIPAIGYYSPNVSERFTKYDIHFD